MYANRVILFDYDSKETLSSEALEKKFNVNNKGGWQKTTFEVTGSIIKFTGVIENQQLVFIGSITKNTDQISIAFTVSNPHTRENQNYQCSRVWKPSAAPLANEKVVASNTVSSVKSKDVSSTIKPVQEEQKSERTANTKETTHSNDSELTSEMKPIATLNQEMKNANDKAVLFFEKGEYEEAINVLRQSIAKASAEDSPSQIAVLHNNLAAALENTGQTKSAVEQYKTSSELFKKAGDFERSNSTLYAAANVYASQGLHIEERLIFQDLIRKEEKANNNTELSASFNNLANSFYIDGKFKEAYEAIQKAISIDEQSGNIKGLSNDYNNLGNILFGEEKISQSISMYKKSSSLKEQTSDISSQALTYHNLGNAYLKINNLDSAEYFYESSMRLAQSTNNRDVIQANHLALSHYFSKKSNCVPVLDHYKTWVALRFLVSENNQLKQLVEQRDKYIASSSKQFNSLTDEMKLLEKEKNNSLVVINSLTENMRRRERLFKLEEEKNKMQISGLKKDKDILNRDKQISESESQKKTILLTGVSLAGVLSLGLFFMALQSSRKSKRATIEINNQKEKIETQHKILEEAHTEIKDSINYAQRLQLAILPPLKLFKENLPNSFVLYKPKNVVAGDFYWMENLNDDLFFAAADCTGHGVPGALVSVVCNNALNRSFSEKPYGDPGEILNRTREIVIEEFQKSESDVKDGMDISFCRLNRKSLILNWAGANNPLWIVRNNSEEVEEHKANKQPIGKTINPTAFTTHKIQLFPGDCIYIFSDGFADQFGGPKGKKLMSSNFKKMLISAKALSMEKQREMIDKKFEEWKGNVEQVDDVCVIGVRV